MAPFAHLHVHSCFSFHDGADDPAALVARAAGLGYGALALTDTNGLYGAVPFCKAAKAAGIAPLLGAEIDGGDPDGPRAVVLARGRAGYPALCRIVTRRRLEWKKEDQDIREGIDLPPSGDSGTCKRDGSARDQRRGGAKRGPPDGADRREHTEGVSAALLRHTIRSWAERDHERTGRGTLVSEGANGRVRRGCAATGPRSLNGHTSLFVELLAVEAGRIAFLVPRRRGRSGGARRARGRAGVRCARADRRQRALRRRPLLQGGEGGGDRAAARRGDRRRRPRRAPGGRARAGEGGVPGAVPDRDAAAVGMGVRR